MNTEDFKNLNKILGKLKEPRSKKGLYSDEVGISNMEFERLGNILSGLGVAISNRHEHTTVYRLLPNDETPSADLETIINNIKKKEADEELDRLYKTDGIKRAKTAEKISIIAIVISVISIAVTIYLELKKL